MPPKDVGNGQILMAATDEVRESERYQDLMAATCKRLREIARAEHVTLGYEARTKASMANAIARTESYWRRIGHDYKEVSV